MYYFHFSLERQNTINNQQKAKSYPNKYLSLIIDGMDQSKTQLPHVVHAIKFTSAMWKLRVHLVGVIVHGIGYTALLIYLITAIPPIRHPYY